MAGFLSNLEFPVRPIQSIPTDAFLDALAHGRPVFPAETLTAYISGDLALFETWRPDLVVGDFRLSLSVKTAVTSCSVRPAAWARLKSEASTALESAPFASASCVSSHTL
jgi:hypothetical protein